MVIWNFRQFINSCLKLGLSFFSFLISFSSFSCCCFYQLVPILILSLAGAWGSNVSSAAFNSFQACKILTWLASCRFLIFCCRRIRCSWSCFFSSCCWSSWFCSFSWLTGCAALAASNFAFNSATFSFPLPWVLPSYQSLLKSLLLTCLSKFFGVLSLLDQVELWRAALILSNWAFSTLRAIRSLFDFQDWIDFISDRKASQVCLG